jgi:hypothetical protein
VLLLLLDQTPPPPLSPSLCRWPMSMPSPLQLLLRQSTSPHRWLKGVGKTARRQAHAWPRLGSDARAGKAA